MNFQIPQQPINLAEYEQKQYEGWNDYNQIDKTIQKKIKNRSNTQSMLSNLSNNLQIYQQSYKKEKKMYNSVRPTICENIKKRKYTKTKLNFQQEAQNELVFDRNKQISNKQNSIKYMENKENNYLSNNENFTKPKESSRQNNITKLQNMFKVLKQYDNLNSIILPSKVNLNKISHKRIIANMMLKDQKNNQKNSEEIKNFVITPNQLYEENNNQVSASHKSSHKTIQHKADTTATCTQNNPLRKRVYSLNIRQTFDNLKKKFQQKSMKKLNNQDKNGIFALNFPRQNYYSNNLNLAIKKRKRSFSLRKNIQVVHPTQKTIQEIKNNYTKRQKVIKNDNNKENNIFMKNDIKKSTTAYPSNSLVNKQNLNNVFSTKNNTKSNKQNEQYFSDSRFFIKNDIKFKRQALGQINSQNNQNIIDIKKQKKYY